MSEISDRAQALLDDPVLTAAFKAVIDEQIENWAKSPLDQAEQRESYYRIIVAVDRVRGKLRQVIDNATFDAAKGR